MTASHYCYWPIQENDQQLQISCLTKDSFLKLLVCCLGLSLFVESLSPFFQIMPTGVKVLEI